MQLLKPAWISSEGQPIFSVDIHPDGTRLAAGGQGGDQSDSQAGRISIWNMKPILSIADAKDPKTPKLLSQMDHHMGCVNCLRWSCDGKLLASGGDDKLVMIWKKSTVGGGAIFGGGGKVNHESWRCVNTLRGHSGDVLDLAWAPDDAYLATASVDNTIIIWNPDNFPEIIKTVKGHSGLVKGVSFDPVGKYLASQSDDRTLRVWRTSDWSEEAQITAPFDECGSTTHVLRPGWAPDGSSVVTAHAMNGGGPTAQIILRDSWKLGNDFVGHKKAVTAVRFNMQMFLKPGNDEKDETTATAHYLCALGSRDRSFSVWSTIRKRPFFVLSDAFDQSVLDLSWSKDGRTLVACSMDGSLACVIMSETETGKPVSEERMADIMAKKYGSGYKIAAIKKPKKPNGTTVFVENPDLLLNSTEDLQQNGKVANGTATKTIEAGDVVRKSPARPKGPTDKQIEARTSDGKRRITPIYIPPGSEDQESGGAENFGSSSSQERSKIEVEKRSEIPTAGAAVQKQEDQAGQKENKQEIREKTEEEKKSDPKVDAKGARKPSAVLSESKIPEKRAKLDKDKTKDGEGEVKDRSPPVNILTVKRKPSQARRRIIVSDSSDDEDPNEEAGKNAQSATPAKTSLDDEKPKTKPELALVNGTKRIRAEATPPTTPEEPPKRKRGRPPLNREISVNEAVVAPMLKEPPQTAAPAPGSASSSALEKTAQIVACASPVLAKSKIDKVKTFSVTLLGQNHLVTVKNRFCSFSGSEHVHMLKCDRLGEQGRQESWSCLLASEISSVVKCDNALVVACSDSSFHVFNEKGKRRFPAFLLPAALAKINSDKNLLCAITSTGKLFLWRLHPNKLEVLMRNECILSVLQPAKPDSGPVTITRLTFSAGGQPLIITSTMKTFVWNVDSGLWQRLADATNTVQALSNYSAPKLIPPFAESGFPLLSALNLQSATAPSPSSMNVDQNEIRSLANMSYCEEMRIGALFTNNPKEYKYWFLNTLRHLASAIPNPCNQPQEEDKQDQQTGQAEASTSKSSHELKLRSHLDELLGPPSYHSSKKPDTAAPTDWQPEVLGLDKRALLRDALKVIGENVHLQRLHMEYSSQLSAHDTPGGKCDDAMEIDAIFNESR